MVRLYSVRAPITGWAQIIVEAEDAAGAIAAARGSLCIDHICEWEEDLDLAEVEDETPDPE